MQLGIDCKDRNSFTDYLCPATHYLRSLPCDFYFFCSDFTAHLSANTKFAKKDISDYIFNSSKIYT